MAEYKFSELDKWAKETERTLENIAHDALVDTIEQAQENTPVDTGYLRRSLEVKTDTGPPGSGTEGIRFALAFLNRRTTEVTAKWRAWYAIAVHYKPGQKNHWVTKAAQHWRRNLKIAATKRRR